jgi:hypothetical protein
VLIGSHPSGEIELVEMLDWIKRNGTASSGLGSEVDSDWRGFYVQEVLAW